MSVACALMNADATNLSQDQYDTLVRVLSTTTVAQAFPSIEMKIASSTLYYFNLPPYSCTSPGRVLLAPQFRFFDELTDRNLQYVFSPSAGWEGMSPFSFCFEAVRILVRDPWKTQNMIQRACRVFES